MTNGQNTEKEEEIRDIGRQAANDEEIEEDRKTTEEKERGDTYRHATEQEKDWSCCIRCNSKTSRDKIIALKE